MQNISFILVILSAVIGCSGGNQNDTPDFNKKTFEKKNIVIDSNFIKVYVDEIGLITANGIPISIANLDSSFQKLKLINGSVYYSRANGQGEPPAESMKVMDLVIKHSLPIKLYSDKTFTVVVTPN